ncbi:uncharacterized protein LOC125033635 [Penaeus chinensis]|uniref:uncharacterized protein LOC125033635 n=1 Tax=Penaeus chinensis TaxID=139456 RepID=UPI001FB5ADA5|nr:uncharacterized protein LOC125033635 [Penaeus chinensis]XP_047481266.1 uncharacterized protein LOC125033635 [Penaeus chinensis]
MTRLREVSEKRDLVALRDKMIQYLPHSAGVRGFLDVLILVQQKLDNKVYVPEGSRVSSLIVVTPSCSQEHIQNLTLFWDTKEEDDEEVVHLLKTLPDWNWSAPVYFRVHPVAICTKIQELKKNGRLGNEQMWSHKVFDGSLYCLDASKLQQIKIPEDFYIDTLRAEDGPTVASCWEYNWTESQKGLESIITNQPSVAIRKRVLEEKGLSGPPVGSRLVAWSLLYRHGFLGNTFTIPEYRRRGLGTASTLAMAETLRQLDITVRIMANHTNTASISYHKSLGFEKQCDMISFIMLPNGKTLQDFIK